MQRRFMAEYYIPAEEYNSLGPWQLSSIIALSDCMYALESMLWSTLLSTLLFVFVWRERDIWEDILYNLNEV